MFFVIAPGETVVSERCEPVLNLEDVRENASEFKYIRYMLIDVLHEWEPPAARLCHIPIEIVCTETSDP